MASTRPNIVLILADDMGYGDIGAFGNPDVQTPALDALACEGVCFTQHYSGSPVCAPARAALMTGRYPHRTGVLDTFEMTGFDRLALDEVTLADMLRHAGYSTGIFGKWHLGALDSRYHPNNRGFDEAVCFRAGWQDYYQWHLDLNGSFQKSDGRYLTDVFTDEAVKFIDRHHREPFFLHVTYNTPHWPFQAPEEDIKPFSESGKFSRAVSTIYGMNRRMDTGIGRIMEALDRRGLRDNTIVLFASDNGPQLGGEGDDSTTRYNAHFNGCKATTYEGGIRVPAILRWPDGLDGGIKFDMMMHFTDWLPTLLTAAGVSLINRFALDGWDVLPALQGDDGKVNTVRFWQWNRLESVPSSNAAMRDGKWKLVRPNIPETWNIDPRIAEIDYEYTYHPDRFTDIIYTPGYDRRIPDPPPALLFDLEADPFEQNDLAPVEPARVRRMQDVLDRWFLSVDADRRRVV
jgi:arylsulfatase A